jgi:hypothetical protein
MKKLVYLFAVYAGLPVHADIIYISGSATSVITGPAMISTPGMYRFANDIVGTITIAANNVTLNLDGRNLTALGLGITITGQSDIIIKNGQIQSAANQGIIINQCASVTIQNIDFNSNATGLLALTTTNLVVQECIFRGHTSCGLVWQDINESLMQNALFTQNSCSVVSDITNCTNIIFNTVWANNNQCSITSTYTLLRFVGTIGAELSNCFVNSNTCIGGSLSGYTIDSSSAFILNDCVSNNNQATGDSAVVHAFLLSGSGIILNNCSAVQNNSSALGSEVDGFVLSTSSQGIILTKCVASENAGTLISRGFSLSGTWHCLSYCIANRNGINGNGIADGYFYSINSAAITTEFCLAKNNIGSSVGGFTNNGANNCFFITIAQAHAPGSNYPTMPPNTATYTVPTGSFITTPNNFDNINAVG